MFVAFTSPKLYLNIILSVSTNFLFDLVTYSGFVSFSNSLTQTLRLVVNQKGVLNNEEDTPEIIIKNINEYRNLMLESKEKPLEDKVRIKPIANKNDLEKIDRVNTLSKMNPEIISLSNR